MVEIALPLSPSEHKFWDTKNRVLFATVTALDATDFAVTRANLRSGGRELNPITCFFGGSTAGLAVNFAGETAGVIGISGIDPQVIDAGWTQDSPAHLPKISLSTPTTKRSGIVAVIPLPPRRTLTANEATVSSEAEGRVSRVSADLGTMTLLADSFVQPNGLAFSVDEGVLYVIDSRRGQIRAFDVLPNGLLAKQTDRLFADLNGSEPGNPDRRRRFLP